MSLIINYNRHVDDVEGEGVGVGVANHSLANYLQGTKVQIKSYMYIGYRRRCVCISKPPKQGVLHPV